jgi:hypothetical protein
VHLGKNPSPCLENMAIAAVHHNPEAMAVLITDAPDLHKEFPGRIVEYSRARHNPWINKYIAKRKEISQIAGGYWLYTTERLFALNALTEIDDEISIIHLESDVYLNLNQDVMDSILTLLHKPAIPRYTNELGIASILISPDLHKLLKALKALEQALSENPEIDNDMHLLGHALNSGIFQELETNPNQPAQFIDEQGLIHNYVYDAAAIGQYLFGQDPFHTEGRRISGYINPNSKFNASEFAYSIRLIESTGKESLFIDEVEVVNLHIHSKLKLPIISSHSPIWQKALNEANRRIERTPDDYQPNLIHTQPISIVNRLRLARKRGFFKSLNSFLLKKVFRND